MQDRSTDSGSMGFKVVLLTSCPPPFGGVAVLSRRLFEGLRSKGIDVEVVSQNPPPPGEEPVRWVGRYRHWILRNFVKRPGKGTIVHNPFHTGGLSRTWALLRLPLAQ